MNRTEAMTRFIDLAGEVYGNPRAQFAAGQRLEPGQPLRVLTDDGHTIDAVAAGKRERKKHVVWITDATGRRWRVRMRSRQILVRW